MSKFAFVIVAMLLAGCSDIKPSPPQVLVCTVNGNVTYRSTPRGWWAFYDGRWIDAGWHNQYKPSMLESCHTEDVAP